MVLVDADPHPPVLLDQQQLDAVLIAELGGAHVAGSPEQGHRMRTHGGLQDHLGPGADGAAHQCAGVGEFPVQRAIQQA